MQKAVVVIPARFDSTRFPGKPLATLKGKFIIQHVYEQVSSAKLIDTVFVATDDKRVFDAVISFRGRAIMTSSSHICGTDRIAEAARDLDCNIVVNVQGDEPFIRPEMVDDAVSLLMEDSKASMSTLAKKISGVDEILSPNVVKVIMDNEGFALYFSRSPIPYYRDEWQTQRIEHPRKVHMDLDHGVRPRKAMPRGPEVSGFPSRIKRDYNRQNTEGISTFELRVPDPGLRTFYCYKHIGIYGFRKDALMSFSSMKKGRLEMVERLEQLRALAAGLKIKVKETQYDTFGIDTIEDLRKAEKWQSLSL